MTTPSGKKAVPVKALKVAALNKRTTPPRVEKKALPLRVRATPAAPFASPVRKTRKQPTVTTAPRTVSRSKKPTPSATASGSSTPRASAPRATVIDEPVTLPRTLHTPRLLSKARALDISGWYRERLPEQIGKMAYAAGVIFTVFSGLALSQFAFSQYDSWDDFQTALVCTTLLCEDTSVLKNTTDSSTTSDSTVATTDGTLGVPVIKFVTKPPSPLIEPFEIVLHTEYVHEVNVVAESRLTGERYRLQRVAHSNAGDFTFTITPKEYQPGEYELRARATALRDSSIVSFSGPRFVVESVVPSTATSSDVTTIENVTTVVQSEEPAEVPMPMPAPEPALTSVTLVVEDSFITGSKRVLVQARDATSIELFIQRTEATQPLFAGHMIRVSETRWRHLLDTTTIANGTYVVFGRARTGAGTVTTPRATFTVANSVAPEITEAVGLPPTEPVTNTQSALGANATTASQLPNRTRYAEAPNIVPSNTNTTPSSPTSTVALRLTSRELQQQLSLHETKLNQLLQRYASAIQSGDTTLRKLATEALQNKRTELLEASIKTGPSTQAASDFSAQLDDEFSRLTARVELFEMLLRERSDEQASLDSDGDGISDYDEVMLYGTNPRLFDTDGDGIPDGVEIMLGFDPLDPRGETVLSYASPQEFGIVRSDVLAVAEVVPVIETDDTRGTPRVQAEIRGRALPHSFVTLFIYSSPTIVTIKTDADGNFVYHLERELEDGPHEIYVTITDNRGDIIAKSTPFTFIKEAQAFTPTDAEATANTPIVAAPTDTKLVRELYHVVTAMGVLAFGLTLLIIGMAMRRQRGVPPSSIRTAVDPTTANH